MIRDSQRSRLYAWEEAVLRPRDGEKQLALDECRDLIERVCHDFNVEPPRVTDGRGHSSASYSWRRIDLPRWARRPSAVLHETAHCLVDLKLRDQVAPHGPEFLRLLIELCVRYLKAPPRELVQSAREQRLKIARADACPKPMDRTEKRLRAEFSAARDTYLTAKKRLDDHIAIKER